MTPGAWAALVAAGASDEEHGDRYAAAFRFRRAAAAACCGNLYALAECQWLARHHGFEYPDRLLKADAEALERYDPQPGRWLADVIHQAREFDRFLAVERTRGLAAVVVDAFEGEALPPWATQIVSGARFEDLNQAPAVFVQAARLLAEVGEHVSAATVRSSWKKVARLRRRHPAWVRYYRWKFGNNYVAPTLAIAKRPVT